MSLLSGARLFVFLIPNIVVAERSGGQRARKPAEFGKVHHQLAQGAGDDVHALGLEGGGLASRARRLGSVKVGSAYGALSPSLLSLHSRQRESRPAYLGEMMPLALMTLCHGTLSWL